MAKTDNLIDYLTDIADAIREKKGTTDPINAQDFADEIRNVSTEGEGSSVSEDDILYYYSGTGSDSGFVVNLSTKEVLYNYHPLNEVLFENDTIVFKLHGISATNGLSMLSTLPFTVERLDDNITQNITSGLSSIRYDYFGVIRNSLGAELHGQPSPDPDGAYLLMDGGLFKLTTGAGKEYLIKITTK